MGRSCWTAQLLRGLDAALSWARTCGGLGLASLQRTSLAAGLRMDQKGQGWQLEANKEAGAPSLLQYRP